MKLNCGLFVAALLSLPGAAMAQQAPVQLAQAAAPRPATSEPESQQYSATYGNWIVRCQTSTVEQKRTRVCEIVQTFVLSGQTAPFAQIAIGRPTPTDRMAVTVVVPVNVALGAGNNIKIGVDDKDAQPVEVPWARCTPVGCFALLTPADDLLKRWRGLDQVGRIVFKNSLNQEVVLPLSFRSLAQAIDGYEKEK